MAVNRCPFCGNYAHSKSVGDAYHLDCSYCEVQIEISKKAYATRCEDPEATLESVYAKMAWSKRPRIDLADMKAREVVPATSASAEEESTSMAKTQEPADAITAAAKAIGSTLGKLAVKTGIAKQPAANKAAPRTAAAKGGAKTKAKAPVQAKTKTAPKKASRKPARRKA